jgi:hypothetical protein
MQEAMMSYLLNESDIHKAETPDIMRHFYDEMKRNNSVATYSNAELSDHLILSVMNATQLAPPDFWIVGRKAQSRALFGDEWADSARKTQHTPIKNHNLASPAGYLYSLVNGLHYDVIRISDPNMQGAIRRLIVPMKDRPEGNYLFFATLIHYEEFLRKAD